MTDIIALVLASARLFTALAFLLFLPGFALLLVFYPKSGDLPFFERIVLSSIVSIGATIGVFLALDLILGVETTAVNSFLSLLIITLLALVVWRTELFFIQRRPTWHSVRSLILPGVNNRPAREIIRVFQACEIRARSFLGKNRAGSDRKKE